MFHIRQSLAIHRSTRSFFLRTLSTTTRPIRRRKQAVSRLTTDEESELKSKIQRNEMLEDNALFVPKDKDGNEITMEEYLKFASLSPWVPVPDVVARRCLDIAKAGPDDVSDSDAIVIKVKFGIFVYVPNILNHCSTIHPRSITNLVQGMEG
jgi:hypothetical protein